MTRLMVLGLLMQYGPMSGYELQQAMQSAQTDTWAGVFPASIYHALKKMDKEGLVELDAVEKTGNRSKAIYSVTPAGKDEFYTLMLQSFQQSSVVFPTELYTALTFFDTNTVSLEHISSALQDQKKKIIEMYENMKAGQSIKEKMIDIPEHVSLIFENIYEQCEIQLRFIGKMEKMLSRLENKKNTEEK
ncbi:PadR family transcriptional regulator [Bacillus pseudomycoides]|uniref:PadR family transcriptional regulator n=1 Tax=Bacillus TaxID=1386 RepID=UPI00036D8E53|nr:MULTISPECIES: PadR family transcriptional regulator [Bacillus]PEP58536.1 PadR family transcriptional regulator [Bacillus pseudomycoides]PGR99292.1 PadR family transcriptional regulator [Bacillus pseudomycoides]PHC92934.1 PadR family transcriptional regulator [Bacillus pseudomycoides]